MSVATMLDPDKLPIYVDAFNLLCHEKIGEGAYRDVFSCRLDPTLVIKVEKDVEWRSFHNVAEMRFWSNFNHVASVKQWLAPCEYLSPDGRVLAMKRAEPLTEAQKKEVPKHVPAFLTDIGYKNFGMLDGRLVCIDYALCEQRLALRTGKQGAFWS